MAPRATELTEEELRAALERFHPPKVHLTPQQVEDILEVVAEWKYRQQRIEDWRRRVPWIFAGVSAAGTVATIVISIVVNFFQSGGHK